VLVALLLLVILSGALYGTYFSLMRGRETAVAKMDARRELSVTLDQLRRELSAAYFNQANAKLHFVVEDRDFFGKPASTLDFTAIAPPRSDGLTASDQVQVIYKAVEKEKKLLLTRQARDLYVTVDPLPYPPTEALDEQVRSEGAADPAAKDQDPVHVVPTVASRRRSRRSRRESRP
jgi:general secretion pathway protein J